MGLSDVSAAALEEQLLVLTARKSDVQVLMEECETALNAHKKNMRDIDKDIDEINRDLGRVTEDSEAGTKRKENQ